MLGQRILGSLSVILLAASVASAGPIVDVIELNHGANTFAHVSRNGVETYQAFGQFQARFSHNPTQTINVFCVDFDHSGGTPYSVEIRSTNDGLPNGAQLAYVYNTHGSNTIASNIEAAAIQIAIFDLQEDGGDGLLSGFFQYNLDGQAQDPDGAAIATRAQQLIDEALAAPANQITNWYDATRNGDDPDRGQSLLGDDPGTPPPPPEVPEPATIVLLGLGAVGLGVFGWRSRRKMMAGPDG